jgi:arylsulfatase A-like enzyme
MPDLVAVAFLALCAAASAARAPGDERPNIIVFLPDTIRADALSVYGHPFVQTPAAARLAASGVTFQQAHAQHTQCTPSRCALFTGRYMHVLGHRTQNHLLPAREQNAFALLKASGYTTVSLGKDDVISVEAMNQTYNFWQQDIGVSKGANPFPFGEAGYYAMAAGAGAAAANSTANGDVLQARLVADLLRGGAIPEPFAIIMTGEGAHPPYGAPQPFHSMYSGAQVAAETPRRGFRAGLPPHLGPAGIEHFRNLSSLPPAFFDDLAAIYLGRVTYTDVQLGAVLDALDASAFANSTAVLFTSDHGDYHGEYNAVEKFPCGLEDALTRVPLIARVPGGARGAVVAAPVETLDVFATLLDLAGLLNPVVSGPGALERHFSASLLPALRTGGGAAYAAKQYVFSEAGYAQGAAEMEPLDPAQAAIYSDPRNTYYARGLEEQTPAHCTRAIMMRNASAKLVFRPAPGTSELYDLAADPAEQENLYGAPRAAALQAQMQLDLLAWLAQTSDVTPALEDPRDDPPPPTPPAWWPARPA